MPLPARRASPPEVILTAKTWKPPDAAAAVAAAAAKARSSAPRDDEGGDGDGGGGGRVCGCIPTLSAATLAWTAAAVSVLDGSMGTLRERIAAARNPRAGALHVEMMIVYPCTFTPLVDAAGVPVPGTGAGTCDAPGCNARVRPFHAVTYSCATGAGVHAKDSPRQQDPLVWARFDILRATPEEVYRLKLYAHTMLGAAYRSISALTYLCDSLSPFGVDASNGWRYYLRHPMVFRPDGWGSPWVAARAASASVVAALCSVRRVWDRCRRRRGGGGSGSASRPRAADADADADTDRAALVHRSDDAPGGADDDADPDAVGSANETARAEAARLRRMRSKLLVNETQWVAAGGAPLAGGGGGDDDDALGEWRDLGVYLGLGEDGTAVVYVDGGDDDADDADSGTGGSAREDDRAMRAIADARVTEIMEDELAAVVAVDVYAREMERAAVRGGDGDDGDDGGAAAEATPDGGGGGGGGSSSKSPRAAMRAFTLLDHLRAKHAQMFAVSEWVHDQTGDWCSMENYYGQLAKNLRSESLAVYKGFTCCEFAAAAFLFAGMIRTGINPRTTLLNNVHTQLYLSGRVARECRVRYEDVVVSDSTLQRDAYAVKPRE